jgi:spore coat polysaccharide biosynthesis protein SpsF (cytidylyltransferase family)
LPGLILSAPGKSSRLPTKILLPITAKRPPPMQYAT